MPVYKMIPECPTEKMLHAGDIVCDNDYGCVGVWDAMFCAAPSPWQPIETAPKSGIKIDLMELRKNGKTFRAPDCYWHKKANRWVCHHHDKVGYSLIRMPFKPTHWMPISPGPNENKKEI